MEDHGYLQLRGITKRFGDKVAVENLDLDIPKGSIYGIIGPNGAGKTTTIRMIMDIIGPDAGQVLLEGKPVGAWFKNMVGYLPEERGLQKKMTVHEVVLFLGLLKKCPKADLESRLDPWLRRMKLQDYKEKKVEELSKGMQQKLQFIATLIHNPDVIILDELFSGLDPLNIELIKNVLLELKREERTILFSTHVMEQAEKLCDYVCMISNGQKVLDGKMTDVKSQHGRDSIHLEIEGDGSFLRKLPGIRGVTDYNNYYELQLNDNADPGQILKELIERTAVRRFELVEPSLYQIFIDHAGESSGEPREQEAVDG
jgi:ABC-2 type transport system ATP-binding protein